jgi:uncharacterized protein YkwD
LALSPSGQEAPGALDQEVVEAHNRVRAEHKLSPLKVNAQLTEAARGHARDMAEHQKLSHEGSDGSTTAQRVKKRGYRYQEVGENIATAETVDQVMRAWLDSPGHRKNILEPQFTEVGVAMVPDAEGNRYWCVDFARPWPKVDTAKAPAEMIAALNRARAEAKRSTVKPDPKLTRVAEQFAHDLAGRKALKSQDRDGRTPFDILKQQGYRARTFGMSLASGETDPAKVVKSWLERREDREALLASYDRVGIAVAVDDDEAPYWVVLLAQSPR